MKLFHIIIIFVLIIILLWSLSIVHNNTKENFNTNDLVDSKNSTNKIHSWIINLDKNKDRLNQSMGYYNSSDLSVVPINRYSAVVGVNLEPEDYLSEIALSEFYETKKRGYRTRHYHLTKGGIGCYLSHLNLFKQLVADNKSDIYLILEDDIKIDKLAYAKISKLLANPPDDWDMFLLGYSKIFKYKRETKDYSKVKSFWGLNGYLINKKGAQKFLDNHTIIDCQIDSFMSWMAIKNKLNIFALNEPIIIPDSYYTDIQINIFPTSKVDSFMYRDVYLGE
jgi:hypothetical protein